MPAERRTRTGVEIARVGRYDLSTGSHEFRREQLAAAVRNEQLSPQRIRLGIGHIDPRFNQADHDGDPAFGRVSNLRLAEDGDVLLGDYVDMAPWLADNIDVAYPGRSLEARVKGDDLHLTAVKLLGVTSPGISTLKDLATAIAASVADGETSEADAHVAIRTLWAAPAAVAPEPELPVIPTPHEEEIRPMDPKTLREQLGLAVDASDEDVTAKLTELNARPTPEIVEEQVAAKAAELAATEIAAAAAKNPTPEHLAALQADAQAGREAKTALDNQGRESFLAAAMGDGKLPPAAKAGYLAQLQQGGAIETATREFIDGLPKNTVPVTEIGASTADDDGPIIESTGWFTPAQLGIKQEVA